MAKVRVDELLVARGLAPDVARARALVMAGEVVVGEQRVDKPGTRVDPGCALRLKGRRDHAYVSRGGVKLAHALDHFGWTVTELTCLDLGASTGGFTDCLLRRGAARIYAVDVGYGQLHWRLRQDPRVVNLERTHAAELHRGLVPEPIDLLVADISFNSLARLLPPVVPLLADEARALLLVKPQFEADPEAVEAGGVVRDPAAQAEACDRVAAAARDAGLVVEGVVASPIPGAKSGNVEFLLAARRRAIPPPGPP